MKVALRRSISGLAVTAIIAAALLLLFSSSDTNTAEASNNFTYTITRKYCNALSATFPDGALAGTPSCTNPIPTTGAPRTVTTTLTLPTGNLNFSNLVTFEPNGVGVTPGCNIDNVVANGILDDREFTTGAPANQRTSGDGIDNDNDGSIDEDGECLRPGDKVGGSFNKTTLGFLNGNCGGPLATVVNFVFYNVALPNDVSNPRASTNIYTPDVEGTGTATRFSGAAGGFGYVDTNADQSGDVVLTSPANTAVSSQAITNYPDWLLDLFDADWTPVIPPLDGPQNINPNTSDPRQNSADGPKKPLIPTAVYGALTSVAGSVTPLYFVQFPSGVVSAVDNPTNGFAAPHPFSKALGSVGQPSQTILTELSVAIASVSAVSDFCTPLESDTLILGTSLTDGVNVQVHPSTAGSHPAFNMTESDRDLDNDGLENDFDTCVTVANTDGNPRVTTGPDGDMIDSACDGTPGTNTGGNDHDGDGFQNAQDNCPQVSNVSQEQAESQGFYSTSAPDGGSKSDSIGDACDSGEVGNVAPCSGANPVVTQNGQPICVQLSTTISNGHYHATGLVIPTCYGAGETDSDGDGWCAATPGETDTGPGAALRHPNFDTLVTGGDADLDGFDAFLETAIGTDPTKGCNATSGPNNEPLDARPTDFNDDGAINVLDINIMKPTFFTSPPDALFTVRNDLNADTAINVLDINIMKPFFFTSCTLDVQQ